MSLPLMVTCVASTAANDKEDSVPAVTDVGFATKLVMVGVTIKVVAADLIPPEPVAVAV